MVSSGNDKVLTVSEKQLADMHVNEVINAATDASSSAGDIEVKFFAGARRCGGLGYCAFPNILLAYQNDLTYTKNGVELPLEPLDICVLIQMLGFLRDGTRIVRIRKQSLLDDLVNLPGKFRDQLSDFQKTVTSKRYVIAYSAKKSLIFAQNKLWPTV